METGSLNSESLNRNVAMSVRGGTGKKQGGVAGKVEPFVSQNEHNPRELRSWAKRTGFVSDYSGEAGTSGSAKFEAFERKGGGSSPKIEIDPVVGRTRRDEIETESRGGAPRAENGAVLDERGRKEKERDGGERKVALNGNANNGMVNNREGNGHGVSAVAPVNEEKEGEEGNGDVKVNVFPEGEEHRDGGWQRPLGLKCGLKENPGIG